ncbi:hypothetical protein L9F63_027529, partial [Diploptera punctata]
MADRVMPTSEHRPQESAQMMSYSGQGVVGSPTSLVENFDTAFSSTVDRPPHNTEYRNVAGADRYDTARRKRVLEEGDRGTPVELKTKKGNHSRSSEGASCSFTKSPDLKRPRTCCPPAGARKNVALLPIKKRKFMHAPAGETEPEHHFVEQEVTVPPPPQQVPVQPQVFPGSIVPPLVSPSSQNQYSATAMRQMMTQTLMLLLSNLSNHSPETLPSSQYQYSGSEPAELSIIPVPVQAVVNQQKSRAPQINLLSTSHFIPCSPPPRVVPPLVSPSSQYQYSGVVSVQKSPERPQIKLLSSSDSDETDDDQALNCTSSCQSINPVPVQR